ncbi:hypothetical protein HY404_03220 [Candidatus Microgenomates bacterium]|nr:hypothetical protein [Candidatus Microgenomates bacterium]
MRGFVNGLLLGILLAGFLFLFNFLSIAKIRLIWQNSTARLSELTGLQNLAIAQAVKDGNYHCCINPPCTMCFWQGNKWNYNTPGTCDCDAFIARGEEACPQCARGEKEGKCGGSSGVSTSSSPTSCLFVPQSFTRSGA